MNNTDITKLSRKQLMGHFEKERQEWLSLGMSEADIFRIHFGEPGENGRGGDYRMWLDERRHIRDDHKYALGSPVSFEGLAFDGDLCASHSDFVDGVGLSVDLQHALETLTYLQRRYFILCRVMGYTYAEIARREGKHKVTVSGIVEAAEKKIKKYFG